jgi:hypothetical protein
VIGACVAVVDATSEAGVAYAINCLGGPTPYLPDGKFMRSDHLQEGKTGVGTPQHLTVIPKRTSESRKSRTKLSFVIEQNIDVVRYY